MTSLRDDIEGNIENAIQVLKSEDPISKKQRSHLLNQLKKTKEKFKKIRTWIELAEQLADLGSWERDILNDEETWSDETYRILGYKPQEVTPSFERFINRVHPDDRQNVRQAYNNALKGDEHYHIIFRINLSDNQIKYIESQAYTFFNDHGEPVLIVGTNQNVTDQVQDKQEIQQSLEENQTLLDEIHHRVKNNLAVVAGMLQLDWLQEDDPRIVHRLRDSANRVKTVAEIHKQLYQSDRYSDLALGENLRIIAEKLIESMKTTTEITLKSRCDEVYVNMDQTLPCSLITNEIITNIIKHAFGNREEGQIILKLAVKDANIILSIQDDGTGLPDNFDKKEDSLGMHLIKTLSKQLNGNYKFTSSSEGTTFSLSFKK